MSKKVIAIIGALAVALVPVIFNYYINLSKPEVKYTLSEEIPLAFSSPGNPITENVQQLEVRNIGSVVAEKIVVKISGTISDYVVVKHTSSDVVAVFLNQQPVEFVYPSLPPQAGFKIIFTSSAIIEYEDVDISHNTGEATEALSSSNRSSSYLTIGFYILLFGGYFIGLALYARNTLLDLWKLNTKYKRIDQALKTSKPWYVSEPKWKTIHLDVIKELLKSEYLPQGKIANSASYGQLNSEKPTHLCDDDWKELNLLATDLFRDQLSKSIDTYSESSVLSVIHLKKPERFQKDEWNNIQTKANEKFTELKKRGLYRKENLVQLLYEEKPDDVPDTVWNELQVYCQKEYFAELNYEINISSLPKEVLANNDLEILDQKQKTKLEEKVWQISKYDDYQKLLDLLLQGDEISTKKPHPLTDREWEKIKDFEALIAQTKDIDNQKQILRKDKLNLEKMNLDVASEREIYSQLKNKVTKQLEFINNLLNDPSIIDRVESYDDTFSPGNLEKLQEIATILNRQKSGYR